MATAIRVQTDREPAPLVPLRPFDASPRPRVGGAVEDAHAEPIDDFSELSPERLGALLRELRSSSGDPLPAIARRLSWHFTPTVLRMIEGGEYPLSPQELTRVLDGYGAATTTLAHSRAPLEVDIENSRLASGDHEWRLSRNDKLQAVLLDYVRFVRTMRNLSPGSPLPSETLRKEDFDTLAASLGADGHAVEASVRAIIAPHTVSVEEIALIAEACEVEVATVEKYIAGLVGDRRPTPTTASPDEPAAIAPVVELRQVADAETPAPGDATPDESGRTTQGADTAADPTEESRAIFGRRKGGLLERIVS